MTQLRADQAKVEWNSEKKQWHIEITVGAEVVKRWVKEPHEAGDATLLPIAVQTAKDEGYALDPARVSIAR
jgi:hypothetical protein